MRAGSWRLLATVLLFCCVVITHTSAGKPCFNGPLSSGVVFGEEIEDRSGDGVAGYLPEDWFKGLEWANASYCYAWEVPKSGRYVAIAHTSLYIYWLWWSGSSWSHARAAYGLRSKHGVEAFEWKVGLYSSSGVVNWIPPPGPDENGPPWLRLLDAKTWTSAPKRLNVGDAVSGWGWSYGWAAYEVYFGKVGAAVYAKGLVEEASTPQAGEVIFAAQMATGEGLIASVSIKYKLFAGRWRSLRTATPWRLSAYEFSAVAEGGEYWVTFDPSWSGVEGLKEVVEGVYMFDFAKRGTWSAVSAPIPGKVYVKLTTIERNNMIVEISRETAPGSGKWERIAVNNFEGVVELEGRRLRLLFRATRRAPPRVGSAKGFIALGNRKVRVKPVAWVVYENGKAITAVNAPLLSYKIEGSTYLALARYEPLEASLEVRARFLGANSSAIPVAQADVSVTASSFSSKISLPLDGSSGAWFTFKNGSLVRLEADSEVRGLIRYTWKRVFGPFGYGGTYDRSWRLLLAGTYNLTVKAESRFNKLVKLYTCPSPSSPVPQCSLVFSGGGRGEWTRSLADVELRGYPLLYVYVFRMGDTASVTVEFSKEEEAVFHLAYWDFNGRLYSVASTEVLLESFYNYAVAYYELAKAGERKIVPASSRAIFAPGETIPNPLYNRTLGWAGRWTIEATKLDSEAREPLVLHLARVDSTGVVQAYAPLEGTVVVELPRNWSSVAALHEAGSTIVFDESNIGDLARIVEWPAHREYEGWYLLGLAAWDPSKDPSAGGEGWSSPPWYSNRTTHALYLINFTYVFSNGTALILQQPVAVSTLEVKRVEPIYALGEFEEKIARRPVTLKLRIEVGWKYLPPSLPGFRLHPPRGIGVALEEPNSRMIEYWTINATKRAFALVFEIELGDSESVYRDLHLERLSSALNVAVRWTQVGGTGPGPLVPSYEAGEWTGVSKRVLLIPATPYIERWESSSPLRVRIAWFCFDVKSSEPLNEPPWRAVVRVDVEVQHPTSGFKVVKSGVFGGVGSTSAELPVNASDKWVTVYLLPVEGLLRYREMNIVVVPLFARYPPRR